MADWREREAAGHRLRPELFRLTRRARRHPFAVLLVAAGLATGAVTLYLQRPRLYSARVVLSVREGRLDVTASPLPKQELRAYISDAAFNKQNLRKLIEKYDLYPGARAIDMSLAIDSMWATLEVDVYQNEFAEYRQAGLRSARIAISFAHADAQVTEHVVDDLAAMIVDFEAAKRRHAADLAVHQMDLAEANATLAIEERRRELSDKLFAFGSDADVDRDKLGMEITRLRKLVDASQQRLELVQQAKAQFEFTAALEARQLALEFRHVDKARPGSLPARRPIVIVLAVIAFLLALVPAALAVAAFDARIHDGADVERLGVPVIGHVPGFPGDRVASLASRRARQ